MGGFNLPPRKLTQMSQFGCFFERLNFALRDLGRFFLPIWVVFYNSECEVLQALPNESYCT
jgi:hypothetical protein